MMYFIQYHKVFKSLILCCLGFGIGNGVLCQPFVPADDTMFLRYYPNLTVFIGTPLPNQSLNKDSSARWPNDPFMVDGVLRIKYLVNEWVYGLEKPPDTIEMISYDHYGDFPFLDTKYAMLYVYKWPDGRFSQLRYKYHSVYQTTDGGWAGPPEAWSWDRDTNHLIPRIMHYSDTVKIRMLIYDDSTYFPDELEEMQESYPTPYYYLNKFDMLTTYGNDVLELFNYEKGRLMESAIFDEKYVDENGVVSIPDVILNSSNIDSYEPPVKSELDLDQFIKYKTFYYTFQRALKSEDWISLKNMLLPQLQVCDSIWDREAFADKFFPEIRVIFLRVKKFKIEKVKAKHWKSWHTEGQHYYKIYKDSLNISFNHKWTNPILDFENRENELFVLENYYPQNKEQKEFYLHFVLRGGKFYLYGMNFTRMRDCYR